MKQQPSFDIYDTITSTIVNAIENGPGNFVMPWYSAPNLQMPINAVTGNGYRGINVLSLWVGAQNRGFTSRGWATFKQWQEVGAQVRKGERGTPIVFYRQIEIEETLAELDADRRKIPFARASWVFNVDQVDGYEIPAAPEPRTLFERLAQVEDIITQTRADIRYGGSRAFYLPSDDHIQIPVPADFTGTRTSSPQESFYSTIFHELGHWAGAAHRLNREDHKRQFDAIYNFEEIIAEMTAAFLCARLDIAPVPRADHAQYIAGYLKMLKEDKRAIFRAATASAAAADFILAFSEGEGAG
ncbi:zincin-like metallopeptidase domain-containing protein [Rhizobium sp. NXC24]|uniref:ArdC family protein n=1 Tax=Rhizobium sp. NXC24 TaxID=2048897 RepID=UPI000CDF4E55|nr:zincin-like metallopeptidase domain-containing protein [Rhizobium sp. NXC24]AVA23845.1 conjugal transfer antirestriction ArdC protein [Rhizobium sp. NXC24]